MNEIKKSNQDLRIDGVLESRKHWLAYVLPIYGIVLSLTVMWLALMDLSETVNATVFGYVFLILGLIALVVSLNILWRINSCRWMLTEEELIIKTGFLPWKKSHFEIPIEDINEAYVSFEFWGKLLGYARLTIRRTEEVTSCFSSNMMVNHTILMRKISSEVKKLKKMSRQVQDVSNVSKFPVSDELMKLQELHDTGVISEAEFATLKDSLLQSK
ncbi:MAG: SHOCT domain-containing protein [Mangrovibacterium sp.]